jgi:hypothetical protein
VRRFSMSCKSGRVRPPNIRLKKIVVTVRTVFVTNTTTFVRDVAEATSYRILSPSTEKVSR